MHKREITKEIIDMIENGLDAMHSDKRQQENSKQATDEKLNGEAIGGKYTTLQMLSKWKANNYNGNFKAISHPFLDNPHYSILKTIDGELKFRTENMMIDGTFAYNEFTDGYIWEEVGEAEAIDWSKVPIDTKVIVSNDDIEWYKCHYAGLFNGLPTVFPNGQTSISKKYSYRAYGFKYFKLAE